MKRPGICVALVCCTLCCGARGVASSVGAATFTVTSGNNSGTGSLRQAVIDAAANPGPDTISITPQLINVSGGTIVYNASGVSKYVDDRRKQRRCRRNRRHYRDI